MVCVTSWLSAFTKLLVLLSSSSKMVISLQLRFSKTFSYENCQILIINWRWGLAGSLFNSKPAVTEVTYPRLTHWGEDNYGCHFSEMIKIPRLLSITPQGYQTTKTNVFLHPVIQKAPGHHCAETRFLLWKLLYFHYNFILRPKEIVHHLQMKFSS